MTSSIFLEDLDFRSFFDICMSQSFVKYVLIHQYKFFKYFDKCKFISNFMTLVGEYNGGKRVIKSYKSHTCLSP